MLTQLDDRHRSLKCSLCDDGGEKWRKVEQRKTPGLTDFSEKRDSKKMKPEN